MSPTHVTPENANATTSDALATRPRVVAAADANDVMREQLDYLIEHAQHGICGCAQCQRYLRARALLMEMFGDPAQAGIAKTISRA